MSLHETTLQYLDGRGLVRDGRVNREEIVARFGTTLSDAKCNDLERAEEDSKSVAEWRDDVLGDPEDPLVDHELNLLAGQMLAIGANGPVQAYLEDGVVLCKTTIRRTDENGVEHVKKGRGRIVSANVDVIEKYHDAVKAAELIRKGQTTRASFDLSGRRVPELAERHQRMLTRTTGEIEQLLLVADTSDDSGDGSSDNVLRGPLMSQGKGAASAAPEFPRTLAAVKAAEGDKWKIADALLFEVGPPSEIAVNDGFGARVEDALSSSRSEGSTTGQPVCENCATPRITFRLRRAPQAAHFRPIAKPVPRRYSRRQSGVTAVSPRVRDSSSNYAANCASKRKLPNASASRTSADAPTRSSLPNGARHKRPATSTSAARPSNVLSKHGCAPNNSCASTRKPNASARTADARKPKPRRHGLPRNSKTRTSPRHSPEISRSVPVASPTPSTRGKRHAGARCATRTNIAATPRRSRYPRSCPR